MVWPIFLSSFFSQTSGNHLAEVPPSELRHRAIGKTDTYEVSVHCLLTCYVLLADTGNISFPVWQACCHDVPRNIFSHDFPGLLRKVLVPCNMKQDIETKSFPCSGFLQKIKDWGKNLLRTSWNTRKENMGKTKKGATEKPTPLHSCQKYGILRNCGDEKVIAAQR